MYIYVKGSDYFPTVSTYSLHLVMPFSHNQKLQCWGKKNKPLEFTVMFTLPSASAGNPLHSSLHQMTGNV